MFICRFFVISSFVELRSVRKRSLCWVAILHAETVEDFARASRLREIDGSSWSWSINVHAEKAFDGAEVADSVELRKLRFKVGDIFRGVGEDEEVVDVDCDGDVVSSKY